MSVSTEKNTIHYNCAHGCRKVNWFSFGSRCWNTQILVQNKHTQPKYPHNIFIFHISVCRRLDTFNPKLIYSTQTQSVSLHEILFLFFHQTFWYCKDCMYYIFLCQILLGPASPPYDWYNLIFKSYNSNFVCIHNK